MIKVPKFKIPKFVNALVFNPAIKWSTQVMLFSGQWLDNITVWLRIKIWFRWYTVVCFEKMFDSRDEEWAVYSTKDCMLVTLNTPLKHRSRLWQSVYFWKQKQW